VRKHVTHRIFGRYQSVCSDETWQYEIARSKRHHPLIGFRELGRYHWRKILLNPTKLVFLHGLDPKEPLGQFEWLGLETQSRHWLADKLGQKSTLINPVKSGNNRPVTAFTVVSMQSDVLNGPK